MVGTAAAGGLGALSIAGVALFGCGFVFEAVADWQKFAFKSGRGSRRRDENGAASPPPTFCSVGLWKVSRHPNYVGEIMCWSGLTLVAAPVLLEVGVGAYAALTLAALSPVMTAVLLLGLSGVPLLEKQVRDAMPPQCGRKYIFVTQNSSFTYVCINTVARREVWR
jgi:steroid 5-alpha reductase family enzyme